MGQQTSALVDEFIEKEQLAKVLHKHPRTLDNWHVRRYGPPRINVQGKHLYRVSTVRQWLASLENTAGREQCA